MVRVCCISSEMGEAGTGVDADLGERSHAYEASRVGTGSVQRHIRKTGKPLKAPPPQPRPSPAEASAADRAPASCLIGEAVVQPTTDEELTS